MRCFIAKLRRFSNMQLESSEYKKLAPIQDLADGAGRDGLENNSLNQTQDYVLSINTENSTTVQRAYV